MMHAIIGQNAERHVPFLEIIFGALMVLGWILLGSFVLDRMILHEGTGWKLLLSAPMIIGAWVFIARHD